MNIRAAEREGLTVFDPAVKDSQKRLKEILTPPQ